MNKDLWINNDTQVLRITPKPSVSILKLIFLFVIEGILLPILYIETVKLSEGS